MFCTLVRWVVFSEELKSTMHVVSLADVWVIWREINSCCFRQKEATLAKMLDMITIILLWMKAKHPGLVCHINHLWVNHVLYLG